MQIELRPIFSKQIGKCSNDIYLYSEVTFHLILIPVPSKDNVVNRFVDRANIFR